MGTMLPHSGAYAQLFSVGILWISVHCAGMCGPLLMGFDVAGVSCGMTPTQGAGRILTYQAGRALTYAWLGGLAGLLGAGVQSQLSVTGGYVTVAFGLVMLLTLALSALKGRVPALRGALERAPHLFTKLIRPLVGLGGGRTPLGTLALGAGMGLMPCMITLWALSLAATTTSPFHGAAIMVLLVAMTTPMLLGVTLIPRALKGRLGPIAHRLPQGLLAISGVWLLLAGSAGLGWIHHAHFGIQAFGRDWAIMFW